MANNNMKETISALMDGEMDEQQMQRHIRELRDNLEHRRCWDHFHIIGDALRNNLPTYIDHSFASRVSQAVSLEDIPAVSPQSKPRAVRRTSITKPVTGFAIAASVAMVAYLGFGMIAVDEQAAGPRLASTTTAPLVAPMVPMNGIQTVQGKPSIQGKRWNVVQPAMESKLNTYLYNHRNVATASAMNSRVMPHARLVISKPERSE